jgi:hypothetical protein
MAPAGGGAWQSDLDQFAPKPAAGFQADLDKLGGGPRQPQQNPLTDDFQRDLDRLGTNYDASTLFHRTGKTGRTICAI